MPESFMVIDADYKPHRRLHSFRKAII